MIIQRTTRWIVNNSHGDAFNCVWLCADDVKKEIKKLKVKGNRAYNNAIDEVLYLCNSQEQKQGVRGVAIVTPLSDASSVSCEHNTGEDVDSSEKTEKFSETTISGSADSKASPVQNHKKKCICKKPILYSAKFMNGICGRCGGEL